MVKSYIYLDLGCDKYKVIRIDNKYPKGHKDRYKEYDCSLKAFTCGCKEYHYSQEPKTCKHLKDLVKMKHIIHVEQEGEYDRLVKEVR